MQLYKELLFTLIISEMIECLVELATVIICIPFENLLFAELLHLFVGFNQFEER